MKYRIFISSVQREFAKERKALASYIRMDRGRRGRLPRYPETSHVSAKRGKDHGKYWGGK